MHIHSAPHSLGESALQLELVEPEDYDLDSCLCPMDRLQCGFNAISRLYYQIHGVPRVIRSSIKDASPSTFRFAFTVPIHGIPLARHLPEEAPMRQKLPVLMGTLAILVSLS